MGNHSHIDAVHTRLKPWLVAPRYTTVLSAFALAAATLAAILGNADTPAAVLVGTLFASGLSITAFATSRIVVHSRHLIRIGSATPTQSSRTDEDTVTQEEVGTPSTACGTGPPVLIKPSLARSLAMVGSVSTTTRLSGAFQQSPT